MKQIIRGLAVSCSLLMAPVLVAAEQDFSGISLKTTELRNNIYMLEGVGGFAGGNIGVSVGEDGVLIVDDQLTPMNDKIKAALAALSKEKPAFILNTHWHGDHTGNNANFADQGTIISHHNARKRLMAEQQNFFGHSPAQVKKAWPIITFDQSLNIHFNNEDIKFIHYANGHTDGDGIVYFSQSNVAHLGDHFFNGVFPFVDLDTGGNVFTLTSNVAKIIETLPDDVLIIPGHGPMSDLDGLKAYHQMLVETTEFVKALAEQGKSLEDIQMMGLADKYTPLGAGFINEGNWIKLIFNSIKK